MFTHRPVFCSRRLSRAPPHFSTDSSFLRHTHANLASPSISKLQHGKAPAASVTRRILPASRSRKFPAAVVLKIIHPTRFVSTSDAPVHRHALPRSLFAGLRAALHPYAHTAPRMSLLVCLSFPAGPLAENRPVTIAPTLLPKPKRPKAQHAALRWRQCASSSSGLLIKRCIGSLCFGKAHFDSLPLTFGIARQRPLVVSNCTKSGKKRNTGSIINRSMGAR